MSGVCGVVGRPGDRANAPLVERMSTWLSRYAPDGRSTWHGGRAALGHALIDTSGGTRCGPQPATLDSRCWIVADARIDARRELVSALSAAGEQVAGTPDDASLILHAWRAWGEECVSHLLGDFAFAIWDARRETLFCARDHLGVKPFFYAETRGAFVFASAIACLRAEAAVPDVLDELAIADYLLFEMSQDPGATAFASIRRLPPAHCLEVSDSGIRMRRYWQPPRGRLALPREGDDALERFDELLQRAVADRLRSPRVSVLMSGGVDSPALASASLRLGAQVKAFCSVYDRIIPDEERHYSSLAARALGIEIRHRPCDEYALFDRYATLRRYFPEPANAPFAAADVDLAADAAAHSRVALTGWDGDALLAESPRPYLAALLARRNWLALAQSLGRYAADHPLHAARSIWLRASGRATVAAEPPAYPAWLEPGFERRLRLRERWHDAVAARPRDPLRPFAHYTLDFIARLANFFEAIDPSRTGVAMEMRHPFFDVRMIDFCLALPTVPWCIRKELLRRWLIGRVPEAVRTRPKTPLAGYPHLEAPTRPGAPGSGAFDPCDEAARFLDRGKMRTMERSAHPSTSWANLRPVSLDLWLRHVYTA